MAFVQPDPGEVRITVFGKERGESIVVHLGGGRWIIVDSLMGTWDEEPDSVPAALGYLRAMGVDPATAVDAIVLTHLHADHSEGIDRVVEACPNTPFYLPSAIPVDHWKALLHVVKGDATPDLAPRMQEIQTAYRWAKDRGNFRTAGATVLVGNGQTVHALAPVSVAQDGAHAEMGKEAPAHGAKLMRKNATSIVLWVQAGAGAALLCADMDNHRDLGWPEALREHDGKEWLTGAGYVKIAHHASKPSQCAEMFARWTHEPVGVLTPNRLGNFDLPNHEDLPLLLPLTRSLWIAGPPYKAAAMTLKDTSFPTDIWWVEASCDPITGEWTPSSGDDDLQRLN